MMVKDEEKYLDKCLKALIRIFRNIDSELIIVDTGSTDNIVEIAKRYTDKVYFHEWNNNFSEIRNVVLSYCKGDWFFYVDGDEILEDCNDLVNFFKFQEYKKYNSASIYIKNLCDLEDETDYSIFAALRLFKKDKDFKFVNAVHNQPLYKKPIKTLSTKCKHYGYLSNDKKLMEKKYKRTATILKDELKKNPQNIYYWYQLSVSYGMHGDNQKAVDCALKAFQLMKIRVPGKCIQKYIYVYTQLALSCIIIRDLKKAEYACSEAIKVGIKHIDIYYLLGKSQFLMKKNNESIKAYGKYLEFLNTTQGMDNANTQVYCYGKKEYVYFDLFILYKRVGKFEKAIEYFNKIQDVRILTNFECIEENISLYLDMNDYDGLKNFYDNVVNIYDIRDTFILYLEKYINKHEVNINKIKDILNEEDSYMLLLNIRLAIQNDDESLYYDAETMDNVLELNLNELYYFYGDILYYYMKYSIHNFVNLNESINLIKNISERKNIEFFKYLDGKYENLKKVLYEFLYFNLEEDLSIINLKKTATKYLVATIDSSNTYFREAFNQYVDYGINYIQCVYNVELLESNNVYCLRNEEEAFFLYMRKANLVKTSSDQKYLYYLKKALDVYPYMNNGIKFLLDEFKKSENISEMEKYKKQVKKTIRALVNENKINDANKLISEYEKIVYGDSEIENIKRAMYS